MAHLTFTEPALYTVRLGLRNGVDIKECNLTLKAALDKTSGFIEAVEATKAQAKCVHAIDISVIRQDSGVPIWTITF